MVTWWPAGTWQRQNVSSGAPPAEEADPVTLEVQAVAPEAELPGAAEGDSDYQLTLKEVRRSPAKVRRFFF